MEGNGGRNRDEGHDGGERSFASREREDEQ